MDILCIEKLVKGNNNAISIVKQKKWKCIVVFVQVNMYQVHKSDKY